MIGRLLVNRSPPLALCLASLDPWTVTGLVGWGLTALARRVPRSLGRSAGGMGQAMVRSNVQAWPTMAIWVLSTRKVIFCLASW